MRILAINPGSTSTKFAVFDDDKVVLVKTLRHPVDELARYKCVNDQFEFRKSLVVEALAEAGIPEQFDAVIGRGGLVKPIPGGVYEVNEAMIRDTRHALRNHACNLGSLIAEEMAKEIPGCRAFIADPGVVDELDEVTRVTGSPLMPRITIWHALNQRAIARRQARVMGTHYEDMNLIIVHLGGGISVGAHLKGRAVDVNNALDGEGPFSPERAGTLPAGNLVELCFSGKYTKDEVMKMVYGKAGLTAHLGTNDAIEVGKRIAAGDEQAKLVYDAMIYQVAKSIAALSVPLGGQIDGILLTGGIAYDNYVVESLKQKVGFLAPVYAYPGEDELEALAMNALGALKGELTIMEYK